jgi:hypothetical protein
MDNRRTNDACRRVAQVVTMEVAGHVDALVRPHRQRVERRQGRHERLANPSLRGPREPRNVRVRAAVGEYPHQGGERVLSLAAHAEVHASVAEADLGVLRWEVAAPHDRHAGMRESKRTRDPNGVLELRAGITVMPTGGQRAPQLIAAIRAAGSDSTLPSTIS